MRTRLTRDSFILEGLVCFSGVYKEADMRAREAVPSFSMQANRSLIKFGRTSTLPNALRVLSYNRHNSSGSPLNVIQTQTRILFFHTQEPSEMIPPCLIGSRVFFSLHFPCDRRWDLHLHRCAPEECPTINVTPTYNDDDGDDDNDADDDLGTMGFRALQQLWSFRAHTYAQ